MMAMDELNVIQESKNLYHDLEEANEEAFLEVARARYQDITGKPTRQNDFRCVVAGVPGRVQPSDRVRV